mmetsp:Transcript_11084/g.21723  ORF Transcript_11084/g.21723 Transcript_11084/m.21723 type:complete len:219 (+) Transcript_11084:166-822(+)
MIKLTAEEQQVLQDFSERLALSEKTIESYRASTEADLGSRADQPNHLKILPTYMLSETLSNKTLEKSFDKTSPSVNDSMIVRPSRLLVPTIKQLSSTCISDGYGPYQDPPSHPAAKKLRRPSSAPKKRTSSKGSTASLKQTPTRPSRRGTNRTSSTASTKKMRRTPSSSKRPQLKFENIPNLRFEVRKLVTILRDHMKKCPALLQDIKRGGGSRLLDI